MIKKNYQQKYFSVIAKNFLLKHGMGLGTKNFKISRIIENLIFRRECHKKPIYLKGSHKKGGLDIL